MPIIRDPKKMVSPAKEAAIKALAACQTMSVKVWVNETLRSQEVQDAYYLQGRDILENVNAKRKIAGLPPINESENKNIITWTLKSKHSSGKAMDLYPVDKTGKILWSGKKSDFQPIADIIKPFGFDWGGDWDAKNLDLPHFEWKAT
jgi:hypothetical protein